MFGSLDDIGPKPLDADLGNLRMLGDDGLQDAGAHLDCLLHQIVEASDFQRRETVDQIGRCRLRPRQFDGFEPYGLLRLLGDPRQPFAVASVEDEQLGAFCHAQHVGQIMALLRPGVER